MKKMLVAFLTLFVAVPAFADASLDQLKQQIADLEAKYNAMNARVSKNEAHTAVDRINWGVEFRSRVDQIQYTDALAMPDFEQAMMGMWLNDSLIENSGAFNSAYMGAYGEDFAGVFKAAMPTLFGDSNYFADVVATHNANNGTTYDGNTFVAALMAGMGAADMNQLMAGINGMTNAQLLTAMGTNPFFQTFAGVLGGYLSDTTLTAAQAATIKSIFKASAPQKFDQTNETFFTNKLRLRMGMKVNKNLSFTGRLLMYKAFGDSSSARFYDGTFKSMNLDGNSGSVPSGDGLHVERAYFVYGNEIGDVKWNFSFGRRPSTYGYGMDNHENAPLGGSPAAHIIQWNFDGGSLAFDFSEMTGIEGLNFKLCYGQGFENGWGNYGAVSPTNDLEDVNFWGFILRAYDDEQYRVVYNYAKAFGITDGFDASVVMPFIISGRDTNLDGAYDDFTFTANNGGFTSRFEPMSSLGDIELHSLLLQGENFGFNWFASYATSKSDPSGRSKNAMMQFMEQDRLLGSTESKSGSSYWVGVTTPELPVLGGKLGVEYNAGSKYWFNFTSGEDHLVASKLAIRGTATEVYYHQPVVDDKFFFTLGWLHMDNEYTNSGNPMGAPVKVKEATAFDTMMPVVDKVDQYYASATYRF